MSTHLWHLPRGAAAALIAIALTGVPAGAQVTRTRDTVFLRTAPTGERMDSIKILMRTLEREQPGSQEFTIITRRLDSLVGAAMGAAAGQREKILLRGPFPGEMGRPKGYIGISPQGPSTMIVDSSGQHVTYLAYPYIVSVEPESPAGRAGIIAGDLLLAYDGIDVIGHDFNLTRMLVPDRKLTVAVKHEGERKDYSLTVAPAPERIAFRRIGPEFPPPPMRIDMSRRPPSGSAVIMYPRAQGGDRMKTPLLPGGIFIMSPNGVLGANMSAVGADLAKILHLATGVLVNEVPESSPAFASGLRAGDVIVSIGGKPVTNLDELHAVFGAFMGTREVPFRLVREKKSRDVTVRW